MSDKTPEAMFTEALDAAGEEAIEEIEAQSEDDAIEEDGLLAEGDDEESAEAASDELDEDAAETDDEGQVDDEVDEADAASFEWDGNPESLTDEQRPIYDKLYGDMRDGVNKWMSDKASQWGQR